MNTAGGNSEIYVMHADGGGIVRLTNNTYLDEEPAWSPDGSKIAFDAERGGNFDVYEMNLDGSVQTRITTDPASDSEPDWQAQPTQSPTPTPAPAPPTALCSGSAATIVGTEGSDTLVGTTGNGVIASLGGNDHVQVFPASETVMEALGQALKPHVTGKGTLRFDPDKPLPVALVKKIVKARLEENAARRRR